MSNYTLELLPIGSMYGIYMVTFTINIPQMLAYIPYMEHMGYRITGWWFQPTPLENLKVSWDHYSQYYGKKTCSSQHQPDILLFQLLTIINHRLTID